MQRSQKGNKKIRRRRSTNSPSMLNLSGSSGFPLCISGINPFISFPKQVADHDRLRKAVIKKLRSHSRGAGGERTLAGFRCDMDDHLSDLIRHLCCSIPLPCAAKAA